MSFDSIGFVVRVERRFVGLEENFKDITLVVIKNISENKHIGDKVIMIIAMKLELAMICCCSSSPRPKLKSPGDFCFPIVDSRAVAVALVILMFPQNFPSTKINFRCHLFLPSSLF